MRIPALALPLLLALPVLASEKDMPPGLAANGFGADLDAALARAKKERRLVLLYLAPSFDSKASDDLEKGALSSKELAADGFLAVRIVVEPGAEITARLRLHGFPAVRILDEDGLVVGIPEKLDVKTLRSSIDHGRAFADRFRAERARADVTNAVARASWVDRTLDRGDPKAAVELYDGFDAKDASAERVTALSGVCEWFVGSGKLDEAEQRIEAVEKLGALPPEQRERVVELRIAVELYRLEKAAARKDKDACFAILDRIAERYPSHELAKQRDELKKKIAAEIEKGAEKR